MYDPPERALRVMTQHIRDVAGRVALDEALRRAVAHELQEQIDAVIELISSTNTVDVDHGLMLAVEQLRRRLNEVETGE